MNKKIVMSLAVIAAATVVMAGGTVAYFTDTEKSTGNTFTAGTIDLKIDSECYYGVGSQLTACPNDAAHGNWALTDLESGVHKFFNYNDIKPGSWGEDTISLHLTSNPAWAWMKVVAAGDLENGCNEPEKETEAGCEADNDGELAENMHYLIWQDTVDIPQTGGKCNNILDAGEIVFKNGTIAPCEVIKLNETCGTTPGCSNCQPLQPTSASDPYCIGMAWCAGAWEADQSGAYHCNGSSIGNEAQGDSLNLDVEFAVVQSMNNDAGNGGPVCP
jgi:predicted ribosomally synthesized peptide with SipW-like signal peptide